MADTVFQVEVGAKYSTSTQRLKNDIQNILNDISKTPPTVTIGVAKTSTKRQINQDLNDLFKDNGKAQYGVTLGLLGSGNIRGSSGKAITKDLLAITSTLSQQKAAKVTVHIDTQATQKAMMAELKKLNLEVTITGGNGNSADKQRQKDLQAEKQTIKEMARLRVEQYKWQQKADKAAENSHAKADAQSRANSYESQYNSERDNFLQTKVAKRLGTTSTAMDDEVRAVNKVNNAYEQVGHTVEVVADRTEKANERMQKSNDKAAQRARNTLFGDAATAQKGIYDTQALLAKTDQSDANYQTLTERLNRYKTSLTQLRAQANQEFGVSDAEFDKEVSGYEKVAKAAENYTIALQNNDKAQKDQIDKDALKNTQRGKSIDSQIDAAIGKLNIGSSAGVKWKEKFEGLRESLKQSGASATEAGQQIRAYGREAKKAGALAETAGQKFSRMLGTKIGYASVALLMNQVTRGIRQIYANVVELDTGMTELKKVTDETDATYQKFLDGAASRAKALGSTMSNVVNATANFARLGYSLDEAAELADAAVVYAHVGDEVESIDEASNSVISTMQAFGVEAKDVMSVVDKFNTIGNRFAISSGGAGEAMQRSAAAMQAAGNSIDETLALIASMNTVLQNPESVGTTLKTVSMYLRASKTEAEAAGESTDGMADSVSKLREEIKSLTGNKVDIMADDNTYKSSFQILKELSQVWDQLSDVSQANILEKLAGKRNANAVSALLTNFDIAEQALLESQNAAGSALAENEKYLDSIKGKLDQLKATWEQFSASVLDSEVVKGAIDLIRGAIEMFNKLDEATGGASSNFLALATALVVAKSVLSAFKLQAADTTSVLGTLIGVFSKDTRAVSMEKMATGISSVRNALSALYQTYKSGGSIAITLGDMIPFGIQAKIALVGVAVAIYGIQKAYNAYRAAHPTFEDLREQSEELKSEVDELAESVNTANERIAELQKLADVGTISLTEQDELDRLKAQNELLKAQLGLKQALLDAKQDETYTKAQEEAVAFFAGTDYTGAEAAKNVDFERNQAAVKSGDFDIMSGTPIELLDLYRQSIQYCDEEIKQLTLSMEGMSAEQAEAAQERIDELKLQRQEALTLYSSTVEPLQNILGELDPTEDAGIIKQIKTVIYQMQMLSGDATALKSVFDDFWSDTATHPGIDKFKEKLEAAVKLQDEYNEKLKKYGSNVDLTNRPHVEVSQDMVDTGLWEPEELGDYSTVKSITFSADELDLPGTQAILVTPIAPDGKILGDYYTVKDYVLTHCVEDGKLVADNAEGDYGITMAIVDEGTIDKSIVKTDELANEAHIANAAFHDLQETAEWDDFIDVLKAVGIDTDALTQADLAALFETWSETAEEATSSLSAVASELDTLTEKYDLLKSAQDELSNSGTISASTLSSIVEKFPELADDVALYIAGMKTGKELIKDLSGAYQTDVDAYKDSLKKKLAASPDFYNSLTDQQKQLIDDLADSYGVDLGNFKTVEQAKLNFQAEIIKKLALNYQRYSGASLEQLKEYRANLRQAVSNAQLNPEMYSDSFVSSRQAELKEVESAIKAIEDSNARLDGLLNGGLEGWDPSKYTDKPSSSSSDSYKKSVDEKINALKHQLAMEKITASQYYDGLEAIEKQYYKDSVAHAQKYADEIRSIDEELFNGRRELNEDWLSDRQDLAERAGSGGDYSAQQDYYNGMYSKLQEMIKAAKDYGLDESSDYVQELYDKVDQLQSDILASVKASFDEFESYMDDFDLWKGSDFSKLDYLQHQLKQIIALYDKGQLSWVQYTEARNEIAKKMYDTQRDSLEEILDLTMDMIKQEAEDQVDALDKQIDAYSKLIEQKKRLLQDTADEADHEEQVAEKVKEIAELQSKIAQLSLDDSREAAAKKASLEQDLYTAQKELADLQRDYSLDQTLEALDKSQEAFEDEKEAEKDAVEDSVDSWQKLYEKAIKRIEGDWEGLYKDLTRYEAEHRDSIDGPDSLVTAWKNATTAMQEYNNSFEDAYNNAGINAIDPTKNQTPEAQAILQKMNNNSALAKALGTSKIGTPGTAGYRDLHQENIDYAQQYYELTGQKLTYDSTAGWKYDNGTSGNTINSSTQNTVKKDTSSGGSAYEATKAALGRDMPAGTLKEGSNGNDVLWLQTYLQKTGDLPMSVTPDGYFYSRTKQALQSFQSKHDLDPDGIYGEKTRKKIPLYHTGGIVGNAGSINDTEVLALLKKGEWVLDDQRKQNLKSLFAGLKEAASGMMSATVRNRMQTMRPAAVTAGGDTFAPHIEVSIQHNGSMSDKDAKQYGNMVANTALEQLKSAFAKRGKF